MKVLKINYKNEKKGWVLIDGDGGEYFKSLTLGGWYQTTDTLAKAFMFMTRAVALEFVRSHECLGYADWLVARATILHSVEAARGVVVKAKKKSA